MKGKTKMLKKIYAKCSNVRKSLFLKKIRKQFGFCGENLKVFGKPVIIFGDRITIGNDVNLNDGCQLNATLSKITIGNGVTISSGAFLLAATYDIEKFTCQHLREHIESPIIIGDNVWICAGAIICPGVKIADGCIIGAGAVVTHDICEKNVLVAGNPAKIIKKYL